MINRPHFFETIRPIFRDGKLTQSQTDGCNSLLNVWDQHYASTYPIADLAYCLATAFWETSETMQPISEIGHGEGKDYGKPAGPYGHVYYGRGLVQLTWLANYQKASADLKAIGVSVDLVADPDKALDPTIAAHILVLGSIQGWFSGKKLSDYLPGDPVNARRVINGLDRAELIAGYYKSFSNALSGKSQLDPPKSSVPASKTDNGLLGTFLSKLFKKRT